MSLNPSNNLGEGSVGFKTIGDPPFSKMGRDCALAELKEACFPRGSTIVTEKEIEFYKEGTEAYRLSQIGIHIPTVTAKAKTEWINVYEVKAELYGWEFRRAWYYWDCEASDKYYDIPKNVASKLNNVENNRKEIRVEGYAGGNDATRNVSSYHVDTPRGLKILVDILKKLNEKRDEERRKKYA